MPIRNAVGPKAAYESKVFTSFLDAQGWEMRSGDWDYQNGPIDFIWCERGIGVELGEWLDQEQAQWVAERDRFRGEIEAEIEKRGRAQFQNGGRTPRCTVQMYVKQLPSSTTKQKVIDDLIAFMVKFESKRKLEIYQPHGFISASGSQLPPNLSVYFASLSFFGFIYGGNLGVTLTKAFDIEHPGRSDSAQQSLTEVLRAKTVNKAETYRAEKQRVGLSELWLVVHYSSPGSVQRPYV